MDTQEESSEKRKARIDSFEKALPKKPKGASRLHFLSNILSNIETRLAITAVEIEFDELKKLKL